MKKSSLAKSYQQMIDWNVYRLDQNKESYNKLVELLPTLTIDENADAVLQADVDDMESLRLIYETAIRNFEGKIQKYTELLLALE
jgi:hypothetical protein